MSKLTRLFQQPASGKNDGALSKQELSAAINSGKLSANEKNVALYLRNNLPTLDKKTVHAIGDDKFSLAPDSKLSHQELVGCMTNRIWQGVGADISKFPSKRPINAGN